jgi:hypothetical protein
MLLLVVIAMAISAGWLYPRDPLALAGRPRSGRPPIRASCSAPTPGPRYRGADLLRRAVSLLIGGVPRDRVVIGIRRRRRY